MHERSYGLLHHPIENITLTSYAGSSAYVGMDGTNSTEQAGLSLNFMDLTSITTTLGETYTELYFTSEEDALSFIEQVENGEIAAVGVTGAYMCHFMRVDENGNAQIVTHFSTYNADGNARANFILAEHAVREFTNLAGFIAEVYEAESGYELAETADPNCYVLP